MTRVSVWVAALAAAVAAGCSGGEGCGHADGCRARPPAAAAPRPPQASCTVPGAPADLHVDSVPARTVSLAWSASSGATEYLVLVGSTSGNSDELFTNTSQTVLQRPGASKVGAALRARAGQEHLRHERIVESGGFHRRRLIARPAFSSCAPSYRPVSAWRSIHCRIRSASCRLLRSCISMWLLPLMPIFGRCITSTSPPAAFIRPASASQP